MKQAQDIAAYLAPLDARTRATLQDLQANILAAAPDAQPCISYGVPAFRVRGKVVAGFAATKTGGSYYPFSGTTLQTLAAELAGQSQTKSAVHFTLAAPLSAELVRKLVEARLAELARQPRR